MVPADPVRRLEERDFRAGTTLQHRQDDQGVLETSADQDEVEQGVGRGRAGGSGTY